ncbi:hypothetical protein K443DRAFT_6458 [Laccaria amethystina LaAM-08-1]|uniref:Uncharacterized protein n=1 Tax=Laccaria amethystina LaAM-08-1 TaxID=1095629 RepID=A0A0C9XAY1_9AGAR|nr:hypothetical protein K443DRAFT_6458 [Laccaria amethystina LaAM-08-1]
MPVNKKPNQERDTAEQLKALGNEFYQKGRYEDAYKTYSDAIKKDPNNAVLYANRAATYAACDARKATEIDPTYAKAWARLGTAMHALSSWKRCIPVWERALACLPPDESMSATDRRLKVQLEEGLKKSQDAIDNVQAPPVVQLTTGPDDVDKVPWKRALVKEQQLLPLNKLSSSFAILNAYRDFSDGVEHMKQIQRNPSGGGFLWFGRTDAIASISNGILRDQRVFHVDSDDWFDKYNLQVEFEANEVKAWIGSGPKMVKEEAIKRLKREGWQSVRHALALTVRAWIMRAFMEKSAGNHIVGSDFYRHALDVLEWGRQTWPNVPKAERGVIFELSFVRTVKKLCLGAMHQRLCHRDADCVFTKEDLAELARELVFETDANPPVPGDPLDAGGYLSFWHHPKGEAFSILGWYHMEAAFRSDEDGDKYHHFTESASYYIQAAEMYPEDDEYYPYYLKIALEAYWLRGAPLRDSLALCKRIRIAIPKMLVFWEVSQMAEERDKSLKEALDWEVEQQRALVEDTKTLDSVVKIIDRVLRSPV